MAKVTFQPLLRPTISLGYAICWVVVPDSTKIGNDFSLIEGVATRNQVVEACGENSKAVEMYDYFRKADVYGEVDLNLILVPKNPDEAPATHDINFDLKMPIGDAPAFTLEITLDGKTYNVGSYPASQDPQQVAIDFNDAINNDATSRYISERTGTIQGSTSLKLTAKTTSSIFDTILPVVTLGDNVIDLTVTANTPAVGVNLDDLPAFLDKKHKKFNLYVTEDGLEETPLIEKLKEFQVMNNRDMVGRYLKTFYDTYSNLIEISKGYNAKYISVAGYKVGALNIEPCLYSAILCGVLGVCYTNGANCAAFMSNSPIGDISNQARPIAGAALDFIKINDNFEWEQTEINNLADNGVWTGLNNDADNLELYTYTTTLYLTSEGRPITTFKYGEADEITNSSMSYLFALLKNFANHQVLDADTVQAILGLFALGYDVLSKQIRDASSGRMYYLLDARGKDAFMTSLKNTLNVVYAEGLVTFSEAKMTMLAQLMEIIANLVSQYYVEQ